jgi:hypothetical protein
MNSSDPLTENISKLILARAKDKETGYAWLKHLIQSAHPEKELLPVSSYEFADFQPKDDDIQMVTQPKFERLSLVYPPSWEFSVIYSVSGVFNVKYKLANIPLPFKKEPFLINYTGIIVQHENVFEFKNESVKILREKVSPD